MAKLHSFKGIAIAGMTACGKSALALALAQKLGGTVINADSAQVYRDLRILSARPILTEEAAVPHRLYGHVDGAKAYSAAAWAVEAAREIANAAHPILVGGTGLYFRALFEGLSDIPPIPADIREMWREVAKTSPPEALHGLLAARDPVMAARLPMSDRQRITRALEVFDATGRPLSAWQGEQKPVISSKGWLRIVLKADRNDVNLRIASRFSNMIQGGALKEVATLLARRLDPSLPVMKAIGVPELAAHMRGDISLAQAEEMSVSATRRYAKRQATWLRTQMPGWDIMSAEEALTLFPSAWERIRCRLAVRRMFR